MDEMSNAIRVSLVCSAVVCMAVAVGCKRPKQEFDGIKGFRVGKTTFKNAAARYKECFPVEDGDKRCLARARKLAGQKALVNLYFPSEKPDARLEEIWVTVQRCNVAKTMAWMKKTFGKRTTENGPALTWKGHFAFIAAQVPGPDGDCQLNFVNPKAKHRIAKLSEKLAEQAEQVKKKQKADYSQTP